VNFNLPASAEFSSPVFCVFSDYEIDLHYKLTVKHVKYRSVINCTPRRIDRDVIFGLEQSYKPIYVFSEEFNHNINVPRHTRLRVVGQRQGTRKHVFNARARKLVGDISQDFKLFLHDL
jgi:hypothetical protein